MKEKNTDSPQKKVPGEALSKEDLADSLLGQIRTYNYW